MVPTGDSESDVRWMRRALELAAVAGAQGEVPVGAVLVRNEVEIACGGNSREADRDPTGHAEVHAIRGGAVVIGDWRLEHTTLYVTLEPCAMCAGAIVLARIPRVVFATPDPKGGFCGTLGDLSAWPGLNHRFAVTAGVLQEEAASQLRQFFLARRKRNP